MYVIGLMSGTSLDGVDAVLVDIKEQDGTYVVKSLEYLLYPMEEKQKMRIEQAMDPEQSNSPLLCSLNVELGQLFSHAVRRLVEKAKIDYSDIGLIASHGQTIYHIPTAFENHVKSTLQVGEPAVIAYETGCTVISNFRTMDMAAGGQGAPLVPIADYHLFKSEDEARILLNLGGIANITLIPGNASLDAVYAFDTGPANMVVDELMKRLYDRNYDKDGDLAAKGVVDEKMLDELLSHPYFSKVPPKTTGREMFGKAYCDFILSQYKDICPEDMVATVTALTAQTIINSIDSLVDFPIDRMIVSGGGVKNKTLIKQLENGLDFPVDSIDSYGISSDEKEALAFALMGYMTLNGQPSNVKSATGASQSVILGNITKAPF